MKQYPVAKFLKLAGIAGATLGVGAGRAGLVAACGSEETTTTTAATAETTTTAAQTTTSATEAASTTTVSAAAEQGRPIKIGWVSAATGPLAFFLRHGRREKWFLPHFQKAVEGGVACADGKNHMFEVVSVDRQSDGARASQVAGDLIMNQKVDIISCGASPAVAIPVSAQAEANGCP